MNPSSLLKRRQQILLQLQELKQIRRGTVTEQYMEATLKDGSNVRRGPYHLYTFKDKQQTVSRRLCNPAEIRTCRQQIDGFRQFQQLTAELLSIGEQLSDLTVEDLSIVKKTKHLNWNKRAK